jgi:uncharacterized protein YukE
MSILHIDLQEVDSVRQKIRYFADQVSQDAHRLDSALRLLEGEWLGGSSQEFLSEADLRLHDLRHLAQEASDLSYRLNREIQKWEEVDSYF